MKPFNWNAGKNRKLMEQRGISFEKVLLAIENGNLLDDGQHPNQDKYPSQRLFIVEIDSYAWLVPYVENNDEIFLKTIIPSRKATKIYLRG